MSRNLGALTSWSPVGLFRPVMGQLYFYSTDTVYCFQLTASLKKRAVIKPVGKSTVT
jgi:hypothetical protein